MKFTQVISFLSLGSLVNSFAIKEATSCHACVTSKVIHDTFWCSDMTCYSEFHECNRPGSAHFLILGWRVATIHDEAGSERSFPRSLCLSGEQPMHQQQ